MKQHYRKAIPAALVAFVVLCNSRVDAEIYTWDFLKGDFDNVSLTPFGDGAVNLVRPTEKGLRLQLPLGEKTQGIGFATRFQLRGDFEVTVRYRIENIQKPKDGWGAGPSIYITTVSDLQPACQLSRLSRKDGREIYSIFRALPVEGDRTKLHKQFDTDVSHGLLRTARVGDTVTWSAADGYSTEFAALLEAEFDSGDVGLIRVAVQQSSPETGGSVFIEHINIIAEALPHLPSGLAQNERIYQPRYRPEPPVPSRMWVVCLACAIIFGATTGTWLVKRRES